MLKKIATDMSEVVLVRTKHFTFPSACPICDIKSTTINTLYIFVICCHAKTPVVSNMLLI